MQANNFQQWSARPRHAKHADFASSPAAFCSCTALRRRAAAIGKLKTDFTCRRSPSRPNRGTGPGAWWSGGRPAAAYNLFSCCQKGSIQHAHLSAEPRAAQSRNWPRRFDVRWPPSCRMQSGASAGQCRFASSSSRWSMWAMGGDAGSEMSLLPAPPSRSPATGKCALHMLKVFGIREVDIFQQPTIASTCHRLSRRYPARGPAALQCQSSSRGCRDRLWRRSVRRRTIDEKNRLPDRMSATTGQPSAAPMRRAAAACSPPRSSPTTTRPLRRQEWQLGNETDPKHLAFRCTTTQVGLLDTLSDLFSRYGSKCS